MATDYYYMLYQTFKNTILGNQFVVLYSNIIMAILYMRKLSSFFKASIWELVETNSIWLGIWMPNFPVVEFMCIWLSLIASYLCQYLA